MGEVGFAFIREKDLQLILMDAVGFVHTHPDRVFSAAESFVGGPPVLPDETDAVATIGARRTLLNEALSRVEAVTSSLRAPDS